MGVDRGKAYGHKDVGLQFPVIFGVFLKCFRKGTRIYLKLSESDAQLFNKSVEFSQEKHLFPKWY